jgi:archaellum biogenesis ATPase FlaH
MTPASDLGPTTITKAACRECMREWDSRETETILEDIASHQRIWEHTVKIVTTVTTVEIRKAPESMPAAEAGWED